MNIYQLIEEFNLSKNLITNELLYELVPHYEVDKWIELTKFFLRGIDHKHHVPGKVIDHFIGICDWHLRGISLTQKQLYYLVHNLIEYWNNISCSAKAKLML